MLLSASRDSIIKGLSFTNDWAFYGRFNNNAREINISVDVTHAFITFTSFITFMLLIQFLPHGGLISFVRLTGS